MIEIIFGQAEKLGPMPPDANVRTYDPEGLWVGTQSYNSAAYCDRHCAESDLPWFEHGTDRYILLDAVNAAGVPARDRDTAETADVYDEPVEDPGYTVLCAYCGNALIEHRDDDL